VQTQAVSLDLCHRAEQLAQQLGIARPVQVLASGIAEVPMTFGMLRQVVLLPVSAIAGLTPQMLEAVIAHELAHIRRYDYVVNLFQTVLETLFFYHPAVWWISKQIRNERENACDDMAVALLGNRVHYVRALTQMEELRAVPASPALAFTQGDLLTRVQRILGVPATPKRVSLLHALSTLGIVVSVFGVLFYASAKPVAAKKSVPTLEVSDVPTHSAHPVPTDLEPVLQSEAVPHPKPVAKAVKHPKLVSAHPSPKANATHPLEEALPSNWKEYLKKEIEKPDVAEAEEDVPEWVKPIVKKAKTEIVEGLVNNTLSKSTLKLAMQAAKDGLQKAKEEMRKSSKQAKTEQVKALKEAESEIQKAFAEIDQ